MKFATVTLAGGRVAFGPVEGDHLVDVAGAFSDPAEAIDLGNADHLRRATASADRVALAGATFLPPIPRPQRILCIGINYASHREETGRPADSPYPTVFVRFPSSVVGHDQPIVLPSASDKLDWEGELAVIIGRRGRAIDAADALDHVAGYACFHDGSVRDFQRHTSQFTAGKNFDRSGAWGPFLVSADEVGDPHTLQLRTLVNGVEMQHASTADLIHDVRAVIAYCSTFTALEPGDVIATGTPGGVGFTRTPPVFLAPGDIVDVVIDRIGTLTNHVVAE